MNLQNLRVFVKVAELEHITKASEALHLSQPAVTKCIQSLEQEFGVEFVERQGRRIVVTHAGRVLQRYAQQMLGVEKELEEALSALRGMEGGEVTMASNATAGVYLLPPIVARFREKYPQVTLHISLLNSQEIIDATMSRNLDVGLVEGDPANLPVGLKVTVFAHDELVLVVAPKHRWCSPVPIKPGMLGKNELLLREQGSGLREVVEQGLLRHGIHVQPLFTLTDNEAIKQMVMSGVGAAIVSLMSVHRELEKGELVQVPIEDMEMRPQLSMIWREDRKRSVAAEAFCAFLRPALDEALDFQPVEGMEEGLRNKDTRV